MLKHLRSSTANKRPQPSGMAVGQLALNTASGSPGLFFLDSANNLVKVGPVHVGSGAPNASPASGGASGNTLGEQWLDTTDGGVVMKVWNGSAWVSESGEFVNASGDTMTGTLTMGVNANIIFEGSVDDGFETTLTVANPTADQTITLPNVTGTVVTTGDTGSVTSTMIADSTIVDGDVSASAAIAGTKISPNFGSQIITTSGVISAALGTATAPSLTFTGDLNTGIYSPGADQLAIATNSTERARIDSAGRLLVGTSTSITSLVQAGLQVQGTGASAYISSGRWSNDASRSELVFNKSRGTAVGTRAIVLANDNLGAVSFTGDDGVAFQSAALILASVDGTPGTNSMPGRLVFSTTPSGSATPVERMRIASNGNISVGTTTSLGSKVLISADGDGSTSYHCVRSVPVFASTASTYAANFISVVDVEDTAWTLPNLDHFVANQSAFGAATVTSQFGFKVNSSLTGATNNYGFYSTIASGTGRWNFYAAGTADSYFASNNFIFANGGSEKARVDSTGRLLLGSSTSIPVTSASAGVQLNYATTNNGASISLARFNNDSGTPLISFAKSRNSTITPGAIVQNGDILGDIYFCGDDGNTLNAAAARIQSRVDNTPASGSIPGSLNFLTTASGSASPVERMRISSAGTTTLTSAASTAPFIANIGVSEVARIDSSGRLLVGTSAALGVASSTAADLEVETTGIPLATVRNSADAIGGLIALGKSRGTTPGSLTAVVEGDILGELRFAGADGTTRSSYGGAIQCRVDGAPGTGDMPGRLVFSTTADGAASPVEKMRISSDGLVVYDQPAPTARNTSTTLTVADLKTKIITSAPASGVTLTVPSGGLLEAGFSGAYVNMAFDWSLINTNATNTVTLASGVGHTIVGSGGVAPNISARFATRRTATNTFVSYRLN